MDWAGAVAQRLANSEFDEAIDAFETIPYEEYSKLVGTKVPVRDAAGNRYHVSLDGDLYVYLGGDDAEHRYYVKSLDRSQGGEMTGFRACDWSTSQPSTNADHTRSDNT